MERCRQLNVAMNEPTPNLLSSLGVDGVALSEVCRRARVARLWLFGSLAAGAAGAGSDADVLVEFDGGYVPRVGELLDLRDALTTLLRRPVDLVTTGAIAVRPDDPFSAAVLRSRRVLYAA